MGLGLHSTQLSPECNSSLSTNGGPRALFAFLKDFEFLNASLSCILTGPESETCSMMAMMTESNAKELSGAARLCMDA